MVFKEWLGTKHHGRLLIYEVGKSKGRLVDVVVISFTSYRSRYRLR